MDLRFGSQTFSGVQIPLLWGTRAVIGHPNGAMSIIDLSGDAAKPEIVINAPWQGVEYAEKEDGFVIYSESKAAYFYSPPRKIIRDLAGKLPECEVTKDRVRIGTNVISNSTIHGFQVGMGVTETGFFIGGPAPKGLAPLIV